MRGREREKEKAHGTKEDGWKEKERLGWEKEDG